jgi:hypothetical protein
MSATPDRGSPGSRETEIADVPERQVRPVIEIEAAEEVLVGFAAAAMLRDDHAGHILDDFRRAQERPKRQVGRPEGALIGRRGNADQIVYAPMGDYRVEWRWRRGLGAGARGDQRCAECQGGPTCAV